MTLMRFGSPLFEWFTKQSSGHITRFVIAPFPLNANALTTHLQDILWPTVTNNEAQGVNHRQPRKHSEPGGCPGHRWDFLQFKSGTLPKVTLWSKLVLWGHCLQATLHIGQIFIIIIGIRQWP